MATTTPIPSAATTSRRFLAAFSALVVFGMLFVVPLCVAMTLCSMPCCHPQNNGHTTVAAAMTGCATQCAVRSDDAKPTTVATVTPDQNAPRVSAVVVIATSAPDAAPPTHVDRDPSPSHRAADASLYVLNSVFRI